MRCCSVNFIGYNENQEAGHPRRFDLPLTAMSGAESALEITVPGHMASDRADLVGLRNDECKKTRAPLHPPLPG